MSSEPSVSTDDQQQQLNEKQRSLHNAVFRSMKRSHDLFLYDYEIYPENNEKAYGFLFIKKIFLNFLVINYGEV